MDIGAMGLLFDDHDRQQGPLNDLHVSCVSWNLELGTGFPLSRSTLAISWTGWSDT